MTLLGRLGRNNYFCRSRFVLGLISWSFGQARGKKLRPITCRACLSFSVHSNGPPQESCKKCPLFSPGFILGRILSHRHELGLPANSLSLTFQGQLGTMGARRRPSSAETTTHASINDMTAPSAVTEREQWNGFCEVESEPVGSLLQSLQEVY